MSIEKAVYTILKDDAGVAALVGTRIYPQLAPQNKAKPYIVYNVITMDLPRHLASSSTLLYKRIQVDMYATKYSTIKDLADKCRLALDNYRGSVTLSVGTVWVEYLALDDENDILVPPQDGSDVPLYRTTQDYQIGTQITVANP